MKLLIDTTGWAEKGYDQHTIALAKKRNKLLKQFYATSIGSEIDSLPQEQIECLKGGVFSDVFPYGYLSVYTSVGGNEIWYSVRDGKFYWANHEIPWAHARDNLVEAVLPLDDGWIRRWIVEFSSDPPKLFFAKLAAGEYDARIEEFD